MVGGRWEVMNDFMRQNLQAMQQKQQEDQAWKDELLATLKSIDEKLTTLITEK